jgi:D-glycero-D-manno-heptose 1,7-bisphosphate phosphatase
VSRRALRPAVFVDRDGTLNREVDYCRRVADLRLLPGAAAGVAALTRAGFAVVVVTNQSGVARGLIPPAILGAIHAALRRRVAAAGGTLAGIYACPHHPEVGAPPLRRRCRCRKPRPGLVERAARELDLDLGRSYVVGDGPADLGLAARAGIPGVLVLTGYGRRTAAAREDATAAAHVAANFRAAAKWIIGHARNARAAPRHARARPRASARQERASTRQRRRRLRRRR